jgi:hypothetical protein
MDISILANEDGNFDPKGDVQWVWKDGAWFQADICTNSISLPPEEFHITVAECPDCQGSVCTYCRFPLQPGHLTLGDPESPASYATCGKEKCNTLIANIIDPAS